MSSIQLKKVLVPILELCCQTLGLRDHFYNLLQVREFVRLLCTSRSLRNFLLWRIPPVKFSIETDEMVRSLGNNKIAASFIRWIFKPQIQNTILSHIYIRIDDRLLEEINIDLAKITLSLSLPDTTISLSVSNGFKALQFFNVYVSNQHKRQQKRPPGIVVRGKDIRLPPVSSIRKFRLGMDARYSEYYYLFAIGFSFPNLIELDLADDGEELDGRYFPQRDDFMEGFHYFRLLQRLSITGNYNLSLPNVFSPPVDLFYIRLIFFSVSQNSTINDNFFQFLSTSAKSLLEVHIFNCPVVTVKSLVFIARLKNLSVVTLPVCFSNNVDDIQQFKISLPKKCNILYDTFGL